jgi:hypothetical protein
MKKLFYIARYTALAVLLLLLSAWAPVLAQNVVFQGQTTSLAVAQKSGDVYSWELYDDGTVNFATTPGNCPVTSAIFAGSNTGPIVNVTWLKKGIYFFKVTAYTASGCTNNIEVGIIEVKEPLPTAVITARDPICAGETSSMEVTLTGFGPWHLTYTDGTNIWTEPGIPGNKYILRVSPTVPTWYWVIKLTDLWGINNDPSNKVLLEVNPRPVSSKIYQYEP